MFLKDNVMSIIAFPLLKAVQAIHLLPSLHTKKGTAEVLGGRGYCFSID